MAARVADGIKMKIARRSDGNSQVNLVRDDLGEILRSDSAGQPVCAPHCPKASPERCSRHCPDIPHMMSSDPDSHPLEPRIAPLVYELKRLEVFDPCWSCEGHNHPDGTLWKVPRVWFYVRSVVHLRVLADAIKDLELDGKLTVPWHLVLTFSDDDNVDTTVSLEPCPGQPEPALAALQSDIEAIAEHLREVVFAEARSLSRTAGSKP